MYDYFFLTSNGYIDRFGCREALIYAYAGRFSMTNDDTHFYFGHVLGATAKIDKVKEIYKNLCDTIWKGNIKYKIVQLKELKKNYSQEIDEYKERYPNTVVIKIDRNVNPRDISLILYLSWFGLIPDISSETRKYYIAKKYTDKIPNTYDDNHNSVGNNLISGNGPNKYMSNMYSWTSRRDLYSELERLYFEHTDEFDWDNAVNSTDIFGIPSTTDEYYDEDDNDEDDEDDDDEEENN